MTLRIKGATTFKGLTTVGPALTAIPGLQLWLDASDASTITIGTGVSQWNDKSGNGNNATQATGSAQPTVQTAAQNGRNTIRFTAASLQVMALTSTINLTSTGYTFLGVIRRGGPSGTNILPIVTSSSNNRVYVPMWFSDGNLYMTGTAQQTYTSSAQSSTTYNQFSGTYNSAGTSGAMYFNGSSLSVTSGASGTVTMSFDQIGRSIDGYANGEIAEILLYNSVLSTANRQAVEAYLKAKWATP